VCSVVARHPRPRTVSLLAGRRRRVGSHSARLRAVSGRRQGIRLDARPLDVAQEGTDARLRQGDVVRRRRAGRQWTVVGDRSTTVAARRRARHDRSSTSQRSRAASRSLRWAAAAEQHSRLHQRPRLQPSAERPAVRQSTRQPKRHQVPALP